MNIFNFVVFVLATWRLASLLADEHGPARILERIRFLLGVYYIDQLGDIVKTHKRFRELSEYERDSSVRIAETEIAKAITCAWCSSVWIGTILILLFLWFGQPVVWVLLPFSVSAGAIIVNRIING